MHALQSAEAGLNYTWEKCPFLFVKFCCTLTLMGTKEIQYIIMLSGSLTRTWYHEEQAAAPRVEKGGGTHGCLVNCVVSREDKSSSLTSSVVL